MRKLFSHKHSSKDLQPIVDKIKPGMTVETTQGDLGEQDISKPQVVAVEQNADGHVERLTIQKGIIFRKKITIPGQRIKTVKNESTENISAKVVIDTAEQEINDLTTVGTEELQEQTGLLDQIEQFIPTTEGIRERESARRLHDDQALKQIKSMTAPDTKKSRLQTGLRILGPGFLAGVTGNDASSVAAYALTGVQTGFHYLWLMLLTTPLYFCTQYACAWIGRGTEKGLAEILRLQYGHRVALITSLALIIANIVLIAADLVAIGSGLQIISGPLHINWSWFIIPVGVILWYLTVYRSFETIKKIFIVMSLIFVIYIVTAFLAHPAWNEIAYSTFVPHIDTSLSGISSAVALLGATISPYSIYWQVQGEKEEERPGKHIQQKMHIAGLDIGIGVVSSCIVAYFIIVCTAATLYDKHTSVNTAADVAQALSPALGPLAEELFAMGLIGAGLMAIPILLASTSYAITGTFGWPAGLSKKPWQSEGFYLIVTIALVISIGVALLHIDPIALLFWANVLAGILAPLLVIALILVGNNRRAMQGYRLSWLINSGLLLITIIQVVSCSLLFYNLLHI